MGGPAGGLMACSCLTPAVLHTPVQFRMNPGGQAAPNLQSLANHGHAGHWLRLGIFAREGEGGREGFLSSVLLVRE